MENKNRCNIHCEDCKYYCKQHCPCFECEEGRKHTPPDGRVFILIAIIITIIFSVNTNTNIIQTSTQISIPVSTKTQALQTVSSSESNIILPIINIITFIVQFIVLLIFSIFGVPMNETN